MRLTSATTEAWERDREGVGRQPNWRTSSQETSVRPLLPGWRFTAVQWGSGRGAPRPRRNPFASRLV